MQAGSHDCPVGTTCNNTLGTYECVEKPVVATRRYATTTSKLPSKTIPPPTRSRTPSSETDAATTSEGSRVPAATTTAVQNVTAASVRRRSLLVVVISIATFLAVAATTILYKRGYCRRFRELHQRSSTHRRSVANNLYEVAICATPAAPPDTSMTYSHLLRESLRQDYQAPSNQSTDYNRLFEMSLDGQALAHHDLYFSDVTVDFEAFTIRSTTTRPDSKKIPAKANAINEHELSETVEPHHSQAGHVNSTETPLHQYEDVDALQSSCAYSISKSVSIDDPRITISRPLPGTSRQPLPTGPSEYLVPVDELHPMKRDTF